MNGDTLTDTFQTLRPYTRPTPRVALATRDNWYLYLLIFILVGYACLGHSFASLGVGPLYIGDLTLAVGLLVAARTNCISPLFGAMPNLLLAILMAWVVSRTLPYIEIYGLDAIRDSVIVMYGLFAFVVIALLLQAPQRLAVIVRAYSRFAGFYAPAGVVIVVASAFVGKGLPTIPGSGIPVIDVRLGELSTHLAGIAIFALLGMRRVTMWWTLALLIGIFSISPNRGGMVACLLSIAMAAVLGKQLTRLVPIILVCGAIFLVALASGFSVGSENGRKVGAIEILENVESVLGSSNAGNLDDTKKWRLQWWGAIEDYTVNGPYFWIGKGFGINLAEADGYMVGQELGGPPLRSPHNGHLTILARAGVPGLLLWALVLTSWFAMMMRSMVKARRRGDVQFANLFLWIACYLLAVLIDASFDVALEGPMLGIWFWCLYGLGGGSAMIYRAAFNTLPPGSTVPILLWMDSHAEPQQGSGEAV